MVTNPSSPYVESSEFNFPTSESKINNNNDNNKEKQKQKQNKGKNNTNLPEADYQETGVIEELITYKTTYILNTYISKLDFCPLEF